jgi:ribosome biogenesis GTPase / thiamine phosphate phosphatase
MLVLSIVYCILSTVYFYLPLYPLINDMEGIVIKSTGSWYTVQRENGSIINCKIKGNFKLKGFGATNPLAVGDKVSFIETDEKTGLITGIHERKNYIIRKATNLSRQSHIIAANIDRAFLIVTLLLPKTSLGFIDRFLATAEAYHIPVTLIFNKKDLYNDEVISFYQELSKVYESLGYPCFLVSSRDKSDIELLKKLCGKGVNLFSGHSGVGKSTLINQMCPELELKTAEISKQHFKGIHTTTFAEMFELPEGGYVIDTPGLKEFGTVHFSPEEIGHYFPEIRKFSEYCKFKDCLHVHEPGCKVKDAVGKGLIQEWRYLNYLGILHNDDNY